MKKDLKILMGTDIEAVKEVMARAGLSPSAENILAKYLSLVRMELDRLWELEENTGKE